MAALTAYRDAPGLSGPRHEPSYVTADDVLDAWMQDDDRLRDACETVASMRGYSDGLAQDFVIALSGSSLDRVPRALRLLAEIEAKVRGDMRDDAETEADRMNESDEPDEPDGEDA